jgi:hypothetical protein
VTSSNKSRSHKYSSEEAAQFAQNITDLYEAGSGHKAIRALSNFYIQDNLGKKKGFPKDLVHMLRGNGIHDEKFINIISSMEEGISDCNLTSDSSKRQTIMKTLLGGTLKTAFRIAQYPQTSVIGKVTVSVAGLIGLDNAVSKLTEKARMLIIKDDLKGTGLNFEHGFWEGITPDKKTYYGFDDDYMLT